MRTCHKVARLAVYNLRTSQHPTRSIRYFTTSPRSRNEAVAIQTSSPSPPPFDPSTVISKKEEKKLLKSGINPIGSKRRRLAIRSSDNIPFEQIPYQCFQEARKILLKDREEKLELIAKGRLRISNLQAQDVASIHGGEEQRQIRLKSMREYLEYLKIQADINDPLIKKRFEDGQGDMNKPIYRYLAHKKWRSYERLITVQRVETLHIVPDVLPSFDPVTGVRMAFRRHNVQPGQFFDSRISEVPPRLKVQVFDKGERLVSVVVVDSDVPVIETDTFTSRCHYLATNIPISPTQTSLPLSKVDAEQLVLPWLPPFAQKGSPYHRLSVFVVQQDPDTILSPEEIKKNFPRENFNMRKFCSVFRVTPIGMDVFRSQWDEGTADVMQRAGIEGADIEFRRKKVIALKPKKRKRGWEARHSGPKYRAVWDGWDQKW